jgi:pyruvate/2-oxoglutarate dehydrogenase complex dihydrolipoamide dehydrogenase (E3) component
VGGGAIGVEYATIFSALAVQLALDGLSDVGVIHLTGH